MNEAEKIRERARADAEKAERLAALYEHVEKYYTGPIPIRYIHEHSYKEFYPSICFGDAYDATSPVTVAEVVTLLELLPPVENWWVIKESCTGIRPESLTTQEKRDEFGNMIGPVVIKVESFQGQRSTYEWVAKLGDRLFEINVTVAGGGNAFRACAKRVDFRGGHRYENSTIESAVPRDKFASIRWASGGPKYPNSFTVMFQPWQKLPEIIDIITGKINGEVPR